MSGRITLAEYKAATKPKKYRNKPVVVDGIKFDSQREAKRFSVLQTLVQFGTIKELERQPTFILAPGIKIDGEARKRPAMRYSADFQYVDAMTGQTVVEDVKSTPTAKSKEFRRIQHLMKAIHNIDVKVVR